MKVYLCEQTSPEWWSLRRGVPTASDFSSILTAKGKRCVRLDGHDGDHRLPEPDEKPPAKNIRCPVWLPTLSKGSDTYIAQLIADLSCLTPNYFSTRGVSRPAENGKEMEAEARSFYAMASGKKVQQVGFILADNGQAGCSPDGVILGPEGQKVTTLDVDGKPVGGLSIEGGLELKCVERHTLAKWWLADPEAKQVPLDHRQQVHGGLVVTGLAYWEFLAYCPGIKPMLVRTYPDSYTKRLAEALNIFWEKYQTAKAMMFGREPGVEEDKQLPTPEF